MKGSFHSFCNQLAAKLFPGNENTVAAKLRTLPDSAPGAEQEEFIKPIEGP